MSAITSRTNPKVKQVRALRQRKERQASGLFLIEGIRPVGEAVEAGITLEYIFYCPERLRSDYAMSLVAERSTQGVPVFTVSADIFDDLTEKENPPGLLAVGRQRQHTLEGLAVERFPWGVALVAPQDPGNLGTILRTVDAVGASGVLLLDSSVDLYHPGVMRASMGTFFWLPVAMTSFEAFAIWATENQYHIYGTSAHGSQDYRQVSRYEKPCILLLGSERAGLTPEQTAVCQHVLRLPMLGRATSLNLAVAAGILLYAMLGEQGAALA